MATLPYRRLMGTELFSACNRRCYFESSEDSNSLRALPEAGTGRPRLPPNCYSMTDGVEVLIVRPICNVLVVSNEPSWVLSENTIGRLLLYKATAAADYGHESYQPQNVCR